jgi:hypothetical protein
MATTTFIVEVAHDGKLDDNDVSIYLKQAVDDFAQDNYGQAQVEDVFVMVEDDGFPFSQNPDDFAMGDDTDESI